MASSELPYFCHSCNTRVQPATGEDNDDIVCPQCHNGFIEKIEENSSNLNDSMFENQSARSNSDGSNPLSRPGGYDAMDFFFPRTGGSGSGSFPNIFTWNYSNNRTEPSSSRNDTHGATSSSSSAPYNLRQRPNRPGNSSSANGGARRQFPEQDLIQDVVRRVFGGMDPPFVEFSLGGGGNFPAFNFMELHGNTGDYAWGPNGLDNIISQLLGQLENAGPPPASKNTIEKLPTITISQEDVDNGKDCTVCMDTFKVDEKAKKLPCSHFFHVACIDPWLELHNTCPICRKVVEDKGCASNNPTNNPMFSDPNAQNSERSGSNNDSSSQPDNGQGSSFFSLFSNIFAPHSNNQDPQP